MVEDTRDEIIASTSELMSEVLARNELTGDDLISIIFTMTPDLSAEFPAVAAREMGLSHIPLICAAELPVPGALEKCIRLMLHCQVPAEREVRHVYLREAKRLRPDLEGAAQ